MPPDSFGRAIRDHHRGRRTEPLFDRDGEATREHGIERWYFGDFEPEQPATAEVFASRPDPTPGCAHRIYHVECEGDAGPTLYFRLFRVDRRLEATVGTPREVADAEYVGSDAPVQWVAALAKP